MTYVLSFAFLNQPVLMLHNIKFINHICTHSHEFYNTSFYPLVCQHNEPAQGLP